MGIDTNNAESEVLEEEPEETEQVQACVEIVVESSSSPLCVDAQVQTRPPKVRKKPPTFSLAVAQVQTSLLTIAGEEDDFPLYKDAEVQTSFLMTFEDKVSLSSSSPSEACLASSCLEGPEAQDTAAPTEVMPVPLELRDVETQTSDAETPLGKKQRSSELRVETHVQTSGEHLPSLEEMPKESSAPDVKQSETPRSMSQPQCSSAEKQLSAPSVHAELREKEASQATVSRKSVLGTHTEAQVQTSHIDIPPGNKWRSFRLGTEAEVQTSFPKISVSSSSTLSQQDTQAA